MAGKVKSTIDLIITHRSQGNANWVAPLKIKLIMKGIDPDEWHESSPDDPKMLLRVESVARDMGVSLDGAANPQEP